MNVIEQNNEGIRKVVQAMEVIRTNLYVRGSGKPDSPSRTVIQYWSRDGELLAEVDPIPEPFQGSVYCPCVLECETCPLRKHVDCVDGKIHNTFEWKEK